MRGTQQSLARRVTLLYVLLGGAWIIFSDQLLAFLVRHPPQMATLQTVKGWIFVAISATLLYSLLRYEVRKRQGVAAELYRVNRALRTLSECNQILIRTTEEPELLQRICQGIVTVGGYRMAWVGYPELDPARRIRPMAQAGVAAGYLETAPISWADTEHGREPAGQAIRTGQPCVSRDILSDPSFGPWRAAAAQRGYAAAIALPLISAGQTLGVLNIYADEPGAFDGEAVRLMTELANDLAFGVSNLRLRSAHQQAEAQVHFQKSLLECQSEAAPDGILVVSPDRKWLSVNKRFLEMWHIPADVTTTQSSELAIQSVIDQLVDPQEFLDKVHYLYTYTDDTSYDEIRLKNGRTFDRYSAPVSSEDGIHYGRVWYYRDITVRKQAETALQQSHEQISNILESITDAFFALDHTWNFIYVNREAEQLLRRPRDELLGQNIWAVFPEAISSTFYTMYHQVREQQGPLVFEEFYPPLETWFEVHAYPSPDGIAVYFRDTTARKRAANHQATRFAVTRILAEAETRSAAIPQLLQAICEGMDWELGQMWQVDAATNHLTWEGNWYRPTFDAQEFIQSSRTTSFARGQGLVGRVWAGGEPAWIADVATDGSFQRKDIAIAYGLHATFAFPIFNGREVTGVITFFSWEVRRPDPDILTLMTDIGSQIGQFVARKQAEEALTWEAEVNAAMATLSHQLIALVAPEKIATLVLEQAKRLTGSTFGYVGYIDQQTGFLVCPTMTRDIWEVCQVMNKGIVFEQFGGLWGWVLNHRQPLLTNEPATDPRSTGTPGGHVPIERFLSVPAMMGPTLLGQIALANAPRDYTDRDLAVIQRMASIYAMAIQRKRDEDAIRQYAGRLQHIHAIDRAILSAHSPADIAQATLSHLYKLVPYQHACVALFDSETDTARILANYAYDTFQPAMQESIPLRAFRSLVAIWEGQTYVKTTVESDDWQPPCCQVALSKRLHSFLTVPLIVQQNTIGALTLGATTSDAFSAESIELVQEVVNQLAIAIQQARLFEQVHDGRERLQTLSRRLVEIQEIERRHIARELHDEIGQTLTGLHLLLEMNSRVVGTQSQNLQNAQLLVNELMRRVREISLDLRPAMLDDLGLLPTLRWHFNRYTTQTGIEVLFKHHGVERRFVSDIETAIYRLVQEALTNIARHAQVDILTVRLWADEEVLEVQIEDTGIGFDQDRILAGKTSSGLTGMRERVELLGGTFAIRSQPGQGTCLAVIMPLEHAVVAV